MTALQVDAHWLFRAAEAPVFLLLLWLVYGIKRDLDRRIDHGDRRQLDGLQRTREELAEFKLEVSRTYVPLSLIRDVDRRLSEHLLRIEGKIEDMRRDQERDR